MVRAQIHINLTPALPHIKLTLALALLHPENCKGYPVPFSPKSKVQLQRAIAVCLILSPKGDCLTSAYGSIRKWDVSRITDMSRIFSDATSFNGDISKWDVSRVKDMSSMFLAARTFNHDLSKWDVSRVANMDHMFRQANSFKRKLCGPAWLHSRAISTTMFAGSPGSISQTPCTFSPTSRAELKGAVGTCLDLSPQGDSAISQYEKFAYTIKGSSNTDHGLYLAITNEHRGESLVSLRGPGFRSP